MGREIKRVPLNFDWPIGKVWSGFVNPHYKKCPDCDSGHTVGGEMLKAIISLIMIAGGDAADGEKRKIDSGRFWPHPYLHQIGCYSFKTVTPDMAELSAGLAGRSPSFMGHDSIDNYSARKKIVKAAGLSKRWGICPTCEGRAIDPAVRRKFERWKPKEPPIGDGWQLWETVSEGAPITPVLASADDLIQYLSLNGTALDNGIGWGMESARAFVGAGYAPSMAIIGGRVVESKNIPLELSK